MTFFLSFPPLRLSTHVHPHTVCPGTCNYRFFTHSDTSCRLCECNTAYSGTRCTMPLYVPGDVQVTFDPRVGQDTPQLTVSRVS